MPITSTYALTEIHREYIRACERFGRFASPHEGIAVIREEYLELEREVFTSHPSNDRLRIEAMQLAAMAMRFMTDSCNAEAR